VIEETQGVKRGLRLGIVTGRVVGVTYPVKIIEILTGEPPEFGEGFSGDEEVDGELGNLFVVEILELLRGDGGFGWHGDVGGRCEMGNL
jgi:hypothetical protein